MKSLTMWLRRLVALAMLAAFITLFTFLPWHLAKHLAPLAKVQFVPAVLAMGAAAAAILVATVLAGRWYCSVLCPLGLLQDVAWRLGGAKPFAALRKAKGFIKAKKAQLAIRLAALLVFIASGVAGLGYAWLEPYGIFGRVMTLPLFACTLGLAIFVFALWQGRVWCNWICPVGTLLGFLSRLAPLKLKIDSSKCIACRKCERGCRAAAIEIKPHGQGGAIDATKCVQCLDCTAACPKAAIVRIGAKSEVAAAEPEPQGMTRRSFLIGATATALAANATDEKTVDGGFAEVSMPGIDVRESALKPAGAHSLKNFASKCVGCQLCVRACPNHVLRPSMRLDDFMQPEMAFDKGFCTPDCTRCSQVCPAGAIEPLTVEEKATTHIGTAVWHKDRCLAATEGVNCRACYRHCPVHAIKRIDVDGAKIPVVDPIACVGCGACEHVCPARPMPAMTVKPLERHRETRRSGEADVLAEARFLLKSGKACVVIKNGVIVHAAEGRGIKPLLDMLDGSTADLFKDAWVVDKVIGRAAAAVCIVGGAKRVFGEIVSEGGKALLEKHSIEVAAGEFVPAIFNRDRSGSCPLDGRVQDLDNPREMVERLRS